MEMLHEPERVQELEYELSEIRGAFEQYIASSRELENGLDKELGNMHTKLEKSTQENKSLLTQMQEMKPLMKTLEASLDVAKKKLKEESRLRRQAEVAQAEVEKRLKDSDSRFQDNDSKYISLREENEALHEELTFKCRELEELKLQTIGGRVGALGKRDGRSTDGSMPHNSLLEDSAESTSHRGDSNFDDSYAEVLDELETVTEQLISTQQKLWRTEDKLRESEAQIRQLESSRGGDGSSTIIRESKRELLDDSTADKTAYSEDEKRLLDELSLMKDELALAHEELRAAEEQAETYQARLTAISEDGSFGSIAGQKSKIYELKRHIRELEGAARDTQDQLSRYEQLLHEGREENIELVEEIACLRQTLHDQTYPDESTTERAELEKEVRSTIMREANAEREKEINVLREKFKKIFKENSTLQRRLDQLENGAPDLAQKREVSTLKDIISTLKAEIARVTEELVTTQDQQRSILLETEATWAKKLEKAQAEAMAEGALAAENKQKEIERQRGIEVTALSEQLQVLSEENEILNTKVTELEEDLLVAKKKNNKILGMRSQTEGNLEASRDETLTLKGELTRLRIDLDNSVRRASKLESDRKRLQDLYAEAKAELEVSKQIIEDAGLEEESIVRDDTIKLKQQINDLTLSLEKMQREYDDLVLESEDNRQRLCESLAGDSKRTEVEVIGLANRVHELEEQLDESEAIQADLMRKLENSRKVRGIKVDSEYIDKFEATSEESKDSEAGFEAVDTRALLTELTEVQAELSDTRAVNRKLREQLDEAHQASEHSIKILDRFFGAENVKRAIDPDPECKTDEADGIKDLSRDPPTSSRSLVLGGGLEQEEDIGKLKNKLLDLTLQNEKLHSQKEQVNALRVCLEDAEGKIDQLETLEEKLKNTESKLESKEEKLKAAEQELTEAKGQINNLKEEISTQTLAKNDAQDQVYHLKTELNDTRRKQASERNIIDLKSKDDHDIQRQLHKLSEEKATVQHQLDDSKIALSVSQYAQERNKEELRVSEAKLAASVEEIYQLKNEISKLERDLRDLKKEYTKAQDILEESRKNEKKELGSKEDAANLTTQLKQLADDNVGLQQLATELEEALTVAHKDIEKKCEEINALEDNLVSTQEETRLLSEEISHLSSAFENAKQEYDDVVDELEAVNELFEEARQEAERSGREAAAEEIRVEIQAARETERKVMKEQLRKVFEENASLQRRADESEMLLYEAKNSEVRKEDFESIARQVEILQDALKSSSEEVKELKKKEFSLTLNMRDQKKELEQAKTELEIATRGLEEARQKSEMKSITSTQSNEHEVLRDRLKNLLDQTDNHFLKPSSGLDSTQRGEGLKFKVELLDLNMSLEKVIKEKLAIEDDLERVKLSLKEARLDGEKQGMIRATREVREEMREEREMEMSRFKEEFNAIVQENSNLQQKFSEAEIALKVAQETQERSREELRNIESELLSSKTETRKFQEEVFNLTVELETANESHERVMEDIRSSIKMDRDAKVNALKHQLSALSIENAALQHKLRTAGATLASNRSWEGRSQEDIEYLTASLHTSQDAILTLEAEVTRLQTQLEDLTDENHRLLEDRITLEKKLNDAELTAILARSSKVVDDNDIENLNSQLDFSNSETVLLRSKVTELSASLEDRTKELTNMKENFNKACDEAEQRGKDSAIQEPRGIDGFTQDTEVKVLRNQLEKLILEKAALQQQVDDAQISLELSKFSQDRNRDELNFFKEKLQASGEGSNVEADSLNQLNADLLKAREEHLATVNVLSDINKLLDSVEDLDMDGSSKHGGAVHDSYEKFLENGKLLDAKVKEADLTLAMAKDAERILDGNLKASEASLVSSSQKAEEIREKITSLTSVLSKSRQEHQSVLKELLAMKEKAERKAQDPDDDINVVASEEDVEESKESEMSLLRDQIVGFCTEIADLERQVEDAQVALKAAEESQQKQNMDLEICERKYEESRQEAALFKTEVLRLQSTLENAQQDHSTLREQLESLNLRVAHMCTEAEERGKAVASEEMKAGMKSIKDDERRELMTQFKRFYEENTALQSRLDKTEIALAGREAELRRMEMEAAKANELMTANKRLNSELEQLKQERDEARINRDAVTAELDQVKLGLKQGQSNTSALTLPSSSDKAIMSVEKEAELKLLQDQFKKLSTQSVFLGRRVEEAESAVSSLQTAQRRTKADNEARLDIAKKIQSQIEQATESSKERDMEIGELAVTMENKLSMTEEKASKLEAAISVAKGALQVSEAGLLAMRRERARRHRARRAQEREAAKSDVEKQSTSTEGSMSTEGSSELSSSAGSSSAFSSESRDDTSASQPQATKRPRAISPKSQKKQGEEGFLSTLALEAIAKGKKKASLRKFDLKHAQSKIFGSEKKIGARTSPFSKKFMTKESKPPQEEPAEVQETKEVVNTLETIDDISPLLETTKSGEEVSRE